MLQSWLVRFWTFDRSIADDGRTNVLHIDSQLEREVWVDYDSHLPT